MPTQPKTAATSSGTEVIVPLVHLNGTSKGELLKQYRSAVSAVAAAREIVMASGPNGRDYYPYEGAPMRRAQDEHLARLERLEQVQAELEAIHTMIEEQGA